MIYLVSRQINLFNSKLFKPISLQKGIKLLEKEPELGTDTETEGLDCFTKRLLLLQLGTDQFQVLFDISSYEGRIPEELKNFLNNYKGIFILQNAKFDLKFLFKQDVIIKKVYDTMLVEIILTNGLQYSGRDLKSLTGKYCGETLDKSVRGEIITKGLSDSVLQYGARDIAFLQQIKRKQLAQAKDLDLLNAIDLDNSFVVVLAYVEFCGIKLDYNKWLEKTNRNKQEVSVLKKKLEDQLWAEGKTKYFSGMMDLWSGGPECIINWDSPKQVINLFKEYGINVILKDKGVDKETIDAKVLTPQVKDFPILAPYLEYKAKQKDVSTYGENWKKYINPITGRIHTTFQQLMNTGRLSCGNKRDETPNLQNIPSDHETRQCFIPEEGNLIIDADYAGQETIILVNQSKEKNLIDFYAKGLDDMHSFVAFLMYEDIRSCSVEDVTPEALSFIKKNHKDKRQIAKAAGFAVAYGGNGSTIAKNCNIPKKDGEFVYDSYFKAFPGMKQHFDLGFVKASKRGYVEFNNVTRRKYFFNLEETDYFLLKDEVNSLNFWNRPDARELNRKFNKSKNEVQRISQNFCIQGSAADTTKYACILLFKQILLRNWWMKVKIINLVHDEVVVECFEDMVEEVSRVVEECMEEAGKPFCKIVPLKAEAIHGDHWVH